MEVPGPDLSVNGAGSNAAAMEQAASGAGSRSSEGAGCSSSRTLERRVSTVSVASSGDAGCGAAAAALPHPGPVPTFSGLAEQLARQLAVVAVSVRQQRFVRKVKKGKTKGGQTKEKKASKDAGGAVEAKPKASRRRRGSDEPPLKKARVSAVVPRQFGSAGASSANGGMVFVTAAAAAPAEPAEPPKLHRVLGCMPDAAAAVAMAAEEAPEPQPHAVQEAPEAPAADAGSLADDPRLRGVFGMWVMRMDKAHAEHLLALPEEARPQSCPGKHSYTLKSDGCASRISVLPGTQCLKHGWDL